MDIRLKPSSSGGIRCRPIVEADFQSVIELLKKGFGSQRSRKFWSRMLGALARNPAPDGMPRYGNLLESDGRPVGVILLIYSTAHHGGESTARCNVSSWYVEPAFRGYASLLVRNALKHKTVTYLNISPAPHTWPILAAQGYSRYSGGLFVAAPLFSAAPAGAARIVAGDAAIEAAVDPAERDLLGAHREYGCISLWCETADGGFPFVFVPRLVRGVMPCCQLVYCRDVADFVRFARPLGWHLARRGRPLVIVDANGAIPGLVGRYFAGVRPKYFKGPHPPRLGDLSYTEAAMFGV